MVELLQNDFDNPKPSHKCSICDKTFLYPGTLKVHLSNFSNPTSCAIKYNSEFTCDICEMSFPLKMNLEDHSKKLHSKSFNQLKKLTARLDLDYEKSEMTFDAKETLVGTDFTRYSTFKGL